MDQISVSFIASRQIWPLKSDFQLGIVKERYSRLS